MNAVDKLKPGKLYEFAVYYGSLETAGTADFFTGTKIVTNSTENIFYFFEVRMSDLDFSYMIDLTPMFSYR